jgi:hypothetical protein
MITVYRTDGSKETYKKQSILTLEWMKAQVGGYIQVVTARDGSEIIVDEEGKLTGKPVNHAGSDWWEKHFGRTDIIVGDCIILTKPHRLK